MLLNLFFETRFAVYLSNMRWKEVPCNKDTYNTFLNLFLDLGTEKTPGSMSGGISVCVSGSCKQFGIFNTFMFLIRISVAVSLSTTVCQDRQACIVFISAL